MEHSFDIEIAEEYGILEAILLKNLWFWIEKNRANETNFFDGYYWTYNSTKAFGKLFPYVSERQIMNALKKLKEEGIIQTGNYNQIAYDRTLWYAFTKKGISIMQKCKMEDAKMENGNVENVEPIPDNKPYTKPNNKQDNKQYKVPCVETPANYVIDLPTNRFNTQGENYYVTEEFFKTMCELYPNTNVTNELKAMKGWLMGNPTKRKTIKGMERFINSWLSRSQNSGKTFNKPTQTKNVTFADINLDDEPINSSAIYAQYEIID